MTARCEGFAPANCRFRWSRKGRRGQKSTYLAGISPHGIKGSDPTSHLSAASFIYFFITAAVSPYLDATKGGGEVFTSVACHEHNPKLVLRVSLFVWQPFFFFRLFVCLHGHRAVPHLGERSGGEISPRKFFKMSSRRNAPLLLRLRGEGQVINLLPRRRRRRRPPAPKCFCKEPSVCFRNSAPTPLPQGTVARPVYTEESAKGVGSTAALLETGKQMFPRQAREV